MNCFLNKSNFIVRRFSHHHSSNIYQTFNIELLYKKVKDNTLKLIEFENKLNELTTELTRVTTESTNAKKELTKVKNELNNFKKIKNNYFI
jgi:hypothetical protein